MNEGAHTLIYKGPNYGDVSIKITFAQLKKMAASMQQVNQQGVEVQSFAPQGKPLLPGILTRHGKVPTITPIPPPVRPVQQPLVRQQQQVRQRPVRQQQQVLPVQQPPQQQLPLPGNQAAANNGRLGGAAMWTLAALGIAGVFTAGYYGISALMMKPAIGRAPTPPQKPQPKPVQTMAPPPVYRPTSHKTRTLPCSTQVFKRRLERL